MSDAPDQRRGVPSASMLHRLASCPPCHKMALLLPPETSEEEREDAASGTRIHNVLAGLADESTLNAAEAETCEMCEQQAKVIVNEWGAEDATTTHREKRLGLTSFGTVVEVTPESRARFIFTGQADLIVVEAGRALVIDYKTGRGDTAEAVDNAQLAGLAVLVSLWTGADSVRVAIVQPWAGKPTVADYGIADLRVAKGWLVQAIERADNSVPDDATPGDWCKFCRVGEAGRCPAMREAATSSVAVLDPDTIAALPDETQRAAMFARAMELPADTLAATVRGLAMVKRFVAAIEGAARERAREDAEFQKFYILRQKSGRRKIANVATAFERASAHGVTAAAFTAECSIGLGDLENLLRAATGAKGKALKEMASGVLDGITETGAPSYELTPVEGRLK